MRLFQNRRGGTAAWAGLAVFGLGLSWVYGPTLLDLARRWSTDPRYSHGFLVPAFSAYLLWSRRGLAPREGAVGSSWEGVALLAGGAGLRLAGMRFYLGWVEAAALVPMLAGVAALFGGRAGLKWAWPPIAYLLFMIPLPYRLELALGRPLQRGAAMCGAWALQTLGLPATVEGHVIALEHSRIGVVEACNGLGMLFTFAALAAAAALVSRRTTGERILIVASAAPIALFANVVRIAATGWLRETVNGRVADLVFHDLAGWLMMPLALGLLWAEAFLLARLLAAPAAGGVS